MVYPGANPMMADAGQRASFPAAAASASTLPPAHASKLGGLDKSSQSKRRRGPGAAIPSEQASASSSSEQLAAQQQQQQQQQAQLAQQQAQQQQLAQQLAAVSQFAAEAGYSSARLTAVRNSSLPGRRSQVPEQAPEHRGRLTVILDVDETLIHSRLSSQQEQFRQDEERKQEVNALDDFCITLEDGEVVRVNKRPGLDKFLLEASQKYELFAYTAGLEEYARPLLDWLDPRGEIFRHRLYRDSCLFMRGYYLKDLQKVNRSLGRTVLVDNNAFCFLPQLSNGIPISSFYDDPNDSALGVLSTFLDRLKNEPDVRPFLRKSFNLETLLRDHREQIVG